MGEFRIPKRFKILGHTVEVAEEPGMFFHRGRFAECSLEGKTINLAPLSPHHPVTRGSVEHSFLHEVVHFLLYHTEQAKLGDNEAFVDLLAGLLHQVLTTMEFE